jgi:hypothetical protein
MNPIIPRCLLLIALSFGLSRYLSAADEPAVRLTPQARPRLTDALRAKAEGNAPAAQSSAVVAMDKVVVRETPLPSGPPKEQQVDGKFSITEGGYLLKQRGEKFSTEVGLWRHIDIMEEPTVALRQSTRIRMGLLRFSW